MKNVVIFNKFINIMKHFLKNVHISNIKCDIIIEAFEGNDLNKTSASKECLICHYWRFLD